MECQEHTIIIIINIFLIIKIKFPQVINFETRHRPENGSLIDSLWSQLEVEHSDFSIYWIIGWALVSAKHINSSFAWNFRGCFSVSQFILFLRDRERASTSLLSVTRWMKWAGHKPAPCYLHPESEALCIVLGNMNSKWKKDHNYC